MTTEFAAAAPANTAARRRKGWVDAVARLTSLVLFAPVVAFPAFLVLLRHTNSMDVGYVAGVCFLFATVWPLASLYGLHRVGRVPRLLVEEREKRTLPFALTVLGYLAGSLYLAAIAAPLPVTSLMLCYAGNTSAFLLLTLRWKPSVHACGVAGPATLLTLSLGILGSLWFLLLVPTAWARHHVGAHTWTEIGVGAGLAVPLTAAQYLAYLRIL